MIVPLEARTQPVSLPGSQPAYPEGNRSDTDKVSDRGAARPTVDSAVILREEKGREMRRDLGGCFRVRSLEIAMGSLGQPENLRFWKEVGLRGKVKRGQDSS